MQSVIHGVQGFMYPNEAELQWSVLIVLYPFITGLVAGAFILASLVRIFRALGYNVVGVNHLGDWGVQCGFQFLAWQRQDPQDPKGMSWLSNGGHVGFRVVRED